MRRIATFVLVAACAAPAAPEARVERVILYRETLTVLMSDGALCVLGRSAQGPDWAGRLEGCPHALPVRVTARPAAPREELAPGGTRVIVAGQGWS